MYNRAVMRSNNIRHSINSQQSIALTGPQSTGHYQVVLYDVLRIQYMVDSEPTVLVSTGCNKRISDKLIQYVDCFVLE